MKNIALIGSTGSVGRQVADVVRRHADRFKIVALAANRPSAAFAAQTAEFAPEIAAAAAEDGEGALRCAAWESADVVFNAAGGFAGLRYSLAALKAGKTLALANKETLVCAGPLVTALAAESGAQIIPVDSEHSAIWQCLHFDRHAPFRRLILTASGGAFRGYTQGELAHVTPAQALNHPTWQMGKKITVDSATLANKGYEVIEAHELYNAPYGCIETVIQPGSTVHSLVEFEDGAVLAQMGEPTMELPIQLALSYPQRLSLPARPMDFKAAFSLEFLPLVRKDHPLYDLALRCGEAGGTLPCVMNAADEVAVQAFLDGRIAFTAIYGVVNEVVCGAVRQDIEGFGCLEEVDGRARRAAEKAVRHFIK